MGDTNDSGYQGEDELLPICHIVAPVGNLGYGFKLDETEEALRRCVGTGVSTAIILDSGSTDSGPSKLGLGYMTAPRSSYARDLTKLLKLVHDFGVPLVFSSAGGDGSDDHVREMVEVIREIASREENAHYRMKTIAIFSEIAKSLVLERLHNEAISGCGPVVPPLTEADIKETPRIVSQMGPEPFIDAMKENPDFDVIVGGRAYDPAPYIAYCAHLAKAPMRETALPKNKRLWGGFAHMGKIMECGGQCATPKSAGATATMYADGTFDVRPNDAGARCTRTSVPAHTLYEKTRPDILAGPGGYLDLNASTYEELEDGVTVRVRGSLFNFSRDAGRPYTLKLEAAKSIGYRSMIMGSIKDPILIGQFQTFLENTVKPYVRLQHRHIEDEWDLDFHIYSEGLVDQTGQLGEIFVIGESLAPTPELAKSIASTARVAVSHGPYPGQKATSGNLAWGHGGKLEIDLGPCAEFCIYHLMNTKEGEERLMDPSSLFTQTVEQIDGKGERKPPSERIQILSQAKMSASVRPTAVKPANGRVVNPSSSEKEIPRTLGDISLFLRSKNAGPYEITFDVIFKTETIYCTVKESDILNRRVIAGLLKLREEDIIWIGFFEPALAFKVTIPRLRNGKVFPNGGFMENDVWAAQKYLPLMNMKLPKDFISRWEDIVSRSNNV